MSEILDEIGDCDPFTGSRYVADGWGYAVVDTINTQKSAPKNKSTKLFEIKAVNLYHEPEDPSGRTHREGESLSFAVKLTGHTQDWQRDNDLARINAWIRALLIPDFHPAKVEDDDSKQSKFKASFRKATNEIAGEMQKGRGIVFKYKCFPTKPGGKHRTIEFEPVIGKTPAMVKERRAALEAGQAQPPLVLPDGTVPGATKRTAPAVVQNVKTETAAQVEKSAPSSALSFVTGL